MKHNHIRFIIDLPFKGDNFHPKHVPHQILSTLSSSPNPLLGSTPKLSARCLEMKGCKCFSPFVAPRKAADGQAITIK